MITKIIIIYIVLLSENNILKLIVFSLINITYEFGGFWRSGYMYKKISLRVIYTLIRVKISNKKKMIRPAAERADPRTQH